MGIHRGPNTVKDGLVFGYDTGYGIADNNTATRFYAGKTTTNYLSNGQSGQNVVQAADWHGATPTFTLGTSEFGTPIGTYNVGGTNYMYSKDGVLNDDLSTLSAKTITFSVYLKRQGADANVGIRVYDNVSGYTTVYCAATSEFQRFTLTKTLGSNPTRIFVMIDNTNGGIIDFHSPQLEIGSTASPFVDGTRSSTASLIDLKRTTSIDVSNVSFDSTGQPTFDGSDDYVLTPYTRGTLGDTLTMIAYYKYTGGSTRTYTPIFGGLEAGAGTEFFIGKNSGNTNIGVQDGNYSGTFVQGSNAWDGNYHQIVYTYNNGTGKIYLDGVLKNTGTFTKCNTAEQITVGRESEGSGYWFLGDIPRASIYNKVFSAEEVLQNYNAYKNRFNI